jgi:polyisoprenyl-phosphate glycosyltransferase
LMALGVIGEYLGRTYVEVKRRPLYFIDRFHASDSNAGVPRADGAKPAGE